MRIPHALPARVRVKGAAGEKIPIPSQNGREYPGNEKERGHSRHVERSGDKRCRRQIPTCTPDDV